jgi:hypothetical protein
MQIRPVGAELLWEQSCCGNRVVVGAEFLWEQTSCGSRVVVGAELLWEPSCGSKIVVGAELLWEPSCGSRVVVGVELLWEPIVLCEQMDGRTDRQTDKTKVTVACNIMFHIRRALEQI